MAKSYGRLGYAKIICPHCLYEFSRYVTHRRETEIVQCEKCGGAFAYVIHLAFKVDTYRLVAYERNE